MENIEFDQKFKEQVNIILKELYSDKWKYSVNGHQIGFRGNGGIVGIHTVSELLNKKGYDVPNDNGWSVLNYFDTNTMVRGYLKTLYTKSTNKPLNTNEFMSWLMDNKINILKEGDVFNELINLNSDTICNGYLNEVKARDFILKSLKSDKFEISDPLPPGSTKDRSGVDFMIKNTKTNKIFNIQAKPIIKHYKNGDKWIVESRNIQYINFDKLDYLVFASHGKETFILFKVGEGNITKLNKDNISFDYEPAAFR